MIIIIRIYFHHLNSASSNDLLERKTRTLEGSLNKLKLTTQRDQNKPAYVFRIEFNIIYRFCVHRMDIYRRGKSIPAYSREKPTGIKSIIKCGQCEKDDAKMVSRKTHSNHRKNRY